ncbi:hypothetical protein HPC49_07490 [Pyxidicoccus fallax]|uniref:Immunity MXAN-0049 protein domain-containing protein n=1 Tax=Pyxidicoccus fallax TaxID=394095 RepID=A0A848LF75_9BACT|nr:DUF1629 domain-containing protein [Pyxidicoccus fallax]NMO15535.1 hypothetical protein [Pyxidicoccus fallax]NPC78095.1 hypothetical protein [Pyxidicoccus fallax]
MQREYFVLERELSNEHPLLGWDQRSGAYYKGRAVEVAEPVRLRLGDPVPPKPVMVDHHCLPKPVVSMRVKEVLEPLQLHRVQFVPADVKVGEDDVRRYWLLHVFNEIPALDMQRSECEFLGEGAIFSIERMVLSEKVLSQVPLHERRVFVLAESLSMCLVHQSVVDQVMALRPAVQGFRFVPVEQWNPAAPFK